MAADFHLVGPDVLYRLGIENGRVHSLRSPAPSVVDANEENVRNIRYRCGRSHVADLDIYCLLQ